MNDAETKVLMDLTENVLVLVGRVEILSAAVRSIARTSPASDACAADFRREIEAQLARQDDNPLPERIRAQLLAEINAILEALGQLRS